LPLYIEHVILLQLFKNTQNLFNKSKPTFSYRNQTFIAHISALI